MTGSSKEEERRTQTRTGRIFWKRGQPLPEGRQWKQCTWLLTTWTMRKASWHLSTPGSLHRGSLSRLTQDPILALTHQSSIQTAQTDCYPVSSSSLAFAGGCLRNSSLTGRLHRAGSPVLTPARLWLHALLFLWERGPDSQEQLWPISLAHQSPGFTHYR